MEQEKLLSKEPRLDGTLAMSTKQEDVQVAQTKEPGIAQGTQEPGDLASQASLTKELSPKEAETPHCSESITIVFMGEKARLTTRPTEKATMRARAHWLRKEKAIRLTSLAAARAQATVLEDQGLPADTAVLYERMLQKNMGEFLEEERRSEAWRERLGALQNNKSSEDSHALYRTGREKLGVSSDYNKLQEDPLEKKPVKKITIWGTGLPDLADCESTASQKIAPTSAVPETDKTHKTSIPAEESSAEVERQVQHAKGVAMVSDEQKKPSEKASTGVETEKQEMDVSNNDVQPEPNTVSSRLAYAFERIKSAFFGPNEAAEAEGGSAAPQSRRQRKPRT